MSNMNESQRRTNTADGEHPVFRWCRRGEAAHLVLVSVDRTGQSNNDTAGTSASRAPQNTRRCRNRRPCGTCATAQLRVSLYHHSDNVQTALTMTPSVT